jgi:hypothetical protein
LNNVLRLIDRMAQNICCAGDDFDYWIPLSFDDEGNVRRFEVRLSSLLQRYLHLSVCRVSQTLQPFVNEFELDLPDPSCLLQQWPHFNAPMNSQESSCVSKIVHVAVGARV